MTYLMKAIEGDNSRAVVARRYVRSLNKNELSEFCGEILAKMYWKARNATFIKASQKQMTFFRWVLRLARKRLKSGNAPEELTKHGSVIKRRFFQGNPMEFERKYLDDSWTPFMRYSAYDACWVNYEKLKICTFCEGDVVYITCPSERVYGAETKEYREFYEEN